MHDTYNIFGIKKVLTIATLPKTDSPLILERYIVFFFLYLVQFLSKFWTAASPLWYEKWIPKFLTPVNQSRYNGLAEEPLLAPIHMALVFFKFIFSPLPDEVSDYVAVMSFA